MGKVVIDVNVIVSAAFGGIPLRAMVRAMKDHEVLVSGLIVDELMAVLPKLSKKLTVEQVVFVNEKLRELVGMAKRVSVTARVTLSRNAKDDHYLALCKESDADYLVTGDKDLPGIPPAKLKENGITCRILTPREFVELP